MKNVKILIPARRNSKGLPFKNRKLFNETISKIPKEYLDKVILSTDDEFLIEIGKEMGLNVSIRPDELSVDETSTKEVLEYHINKGEINICDTIIMLYLTYPERSWLEVEKAYELFNIKKLKSFLCKKSLTGTHPYLFMIDSGDGKGEQLVKHNLYRRQDYPKVFEISHYIGIFNVIYINKLNNNLYNENTYFYEIGDVIDVDTKEDLDGLFRKKKEIK